MTDKRKAIFFTADMHIGHANVIKFDERPFRDLNHMHETLIIRYNATVPSDGICYFLGDIGVTQNSVVKNIITRLNGTKVLILGNHDKNTYSMYNAGFDVVLNAGIFYIGNKRISMSHCPLPKVFREDCTKMNRYVEGDNWHGEHKNQMFISQDNTVDYHLHGHIHSGPKKSNEEPIKEHYTYNQFDVGVRGNGYTPVSISRIESWIDKSK
jgi:calcineurin-like phosphoesterase family protein